MQLHFSLPSYFTSLHLDSNRSFYIPIKTAISPVKLDILSLCCNSDVLYCYAFYWNFQSGVCCLYFLYNGFLINKPITLNIDGKS